MKKSPIEKATPLIIHFWLAVSIATLIYAVYRIWINGWDLESDNLLIPLIAFSWYLFRRAMYRRMKRQQDRQDG